MRHSASAMICIAFAALSCIAQQNFQAIPKPPGKYAAIGNPMTVVGSLDGLIQASKLIIDGTVDKVFPSVRLGANDPRSLETHSGISINKVIWGELPEGHKRVAIAEPGGSLEGYEVTVKNHTFVKSGERYILFLTPYRRLEKLAGMSIIAIVESLNAKVQVDERVGMPLYTIAGSWSGKVQVDEKEMVQFQPAASPVLHSSDGLDVDKFINSITDLISRMYHKPPKDGPVQVGLPPPGMHLPPAGIPSY
jgi:hypothetical protein